jgi:ureidoglycolate dehydrogenase (NAD+)
MDLLLRDLHASETAEGFERVYAPGEIEQLRAAERLRTGVPIATAVVRELSAIGATLGLPPLEGTAAPA